MNQTTTYNDSDSNASFGGESSFSNQSEFDYLLQYTTSGADYQMEFDKTYSLEATGINKIPEFEVRPTDFFQHFFIPLSAELTVGEYSNPAGDGQPEALATWRGDANLVVGPLEAKVLGSDFQGTVTVDQYAYGTGDLKAAIEQDLSLTTPVSRTSSIRLPTTRPTTTARRWCRSNTSISNPREHEERAGYGAPLQRRRVRIFAGLGNEFRRRRAAAELSAHGAAVARVRC